ncbi:spore germination protein [Metabacillus bambusae]|uniref:Spore germination protein n=1 Tax=Metabacillus bambusae TaxID=2795218 RepID=A0ABS3N8C2_9BACI|nr:spore germination protein [Metabacillus bambusae]MBO1514458.1 spore germination protein [Metabacillus bambusae]
MSSNDKQMLDDEQDQTFESLFKQFQQSNDFTLFPIQTTNEIVKIGYYTSLIDVEILHKDVFPYLLQFDGTSIHQLVHVLPIESITITRKAKEVQTQLLSGAIMIILQNDPSIAALIKAKVERTRQVSLPEVEFSVVGPKESLVESLDTNLNLIRKRLPIPELLTKELVIGKLSKTRVAVLYIEGITNEENVNTVIQRLTDLDVDQINDSSYITQLIQDNPNSPFPQFIDTERPDRLASVLGEGKVVILTDGAPHGLIGPTTLIEFFSAFEDYFLNWMVASFFRLVRLFSVLFSILVTPIYVAVLTYHYELIPKALVSTLVTSRSAIPLPPILEALILELAIELLREAGARLPTKVGQTIGIVGGIVIGTASVEAGLTSNVLLIIVALAALASFTTPVYQMGNTIRLIRFPFLLFAHYIGLIGVALCFCFLLIHLLRLTSLGRPFLEPLFPPRFSDLKDAFIRLPFSFQSKRPIELQTEDTLRFNSKKGKEKKNNKQ